MLQNWQLDGFPYFWTFSSHFLQILEVLLLLKYFDWKIVISSKNFFILWMIWFINKTIKVTYLSCWNSDLQYVHLTTGNDPLHSLHNCCPCDSSSNGWRLKHLLQANKATPGGRPWFTPEAAILITVSIPLVRGWSRYRNIRTKSWKILEMWNCSYTYLTIHDDNS